MKEKFSIIFVYISMFVYIYINVYTVYIHLHILLQNQCYDDDFLFFSFFLLGAKEEDLESGNGPSLPQSPQSVAGEGMGGPSLDSDLEQEQGRHPIFDYKWENKVTS